MSLKMKVVPAKRNGRRCTRHRARWIHDQFVCDCGSRKFTVFRERVAHKVHRRDTRRRRRVGICAKGHKTRIAFR